MTTTYDVGLTATAHDLLANAEALYGPRDLSWTFAGVGLHADGPHIWYPNLPERRVEIHIATDALAYPNQVLYQLAHEVIHLLAPGGSSAPMVEEGIAVKFSIEVPNFPSGNYRDLARKHIASNPGSANYRDAVEAVDQLLISAPDAISRLRSKRTSFKDWTPDFIRSEIEIDEDLATRLCEVRSMR